MERFTLMVSAKQRAARAKFARIMRSGGFRKRKSSRRKVHKSGIRTMTMARRGRSRRIRRSFGRARGSLGGVKSTLAPFVAGIGGGMLAKEVSMRVFPQASPIASIAGGWLFGGTKGVIGSVAYDAITGQGGLLGGIFGGGSSNSGGDSL